MKERVLTLIEYEERAKARGAHCKRCRRVFAHEALQYSDGAWPSSDRRHFVDLGQSYGSVVLFFKCFQCGIVSTLEEAVPRKQKTALPATSFNAHLLQKLRLRSRPSADSSMLVLEPYDSP